MCLQTHRSLNNTAGYIFEDDSGVDQNRDDRINRCGHSGLRYQYSHLDRLSTEVQITVSAEREKIRLVRYLIASNPSCDTVAELVQPRLVQRTSRQNHRLINP